MVVEDDEGKRSVVPIELGEISVGREEGSTVRLNERNISRTHCRFSANGGGVFAEDLDSYNGIFVNGDRVQGRQMLHQGDLIRVGDFHLELRGEGLGTRPEDTTQRTTAPDLDSTVRTTAPTMELTQPEIRVQAEVEESRAEPTALIRMDQLAAMHEDTLPVSSAVAGKQGRLICVSTEYAGREYNLQHTNISIGRTSENEITIDHRSVSSNHARITSSAAGFKIVDLSSSNGTLVNGEEYAQISLKTGDLIELGHVKFRFVGPGAQYTLPADEAAAAGRNAGATAPIAAPMSAEETIMGPHPVVKLIQDNPLGAAALALGFVTILLLGVYLGGGGEAPIAELQTAMEVQGGDKLLIQARTYMDNREWGKAARLLKLSIEHDPTNDDALTMLGTCDAEAKVKLIYDRANLAIQSSDWSAAWNALMDIPKTSVYHGDAGPLRDQVRSAKITENIVRFRVRLTDGHLEDADQLLAEVESLDPTYAELPVLKAELSSARRKGSIAAIEAQATSKPKTSKGSKPGSRRPKSTSASRNEPSPKVLNKNSGKTTSRNTGAKGNDARSLYNQAVKAVQARNYEAATKLFIKCNQVDGSYCACYRGAGIAYAKMEQPRKAARYYRTFVKTCPSHKDAEKVRKMLGG